MADTTYLKKVVEPYVRDQLNKEFNVPFESKVLNLTTGGKHEFDAVSDDKNIVAAIKSAGGMTITNKKPSGKIKDSLSELYFLTLVQASKKMLILTSEEFHGILSNFLKGRLALGLELKLMQLPMEIQHQVEKIRQKASSEVSKSSKR